MRTVRLMVSFLLAVLIVMLALPLLGFFVLWVLTKVGVT